MKKPTPNHPETDADPTSPYATIDSKKLNEAADHYLKPTIHIMASTRVAEPCTSPTRFTLLRRIKNPMPAQASDFSCSQRLGEGAPQAGVIAR